MCYVALSQGNLCSVRQRAKPLFDSFNNLCCLVRDCECFGTRSKNRFSFCKHPESSRLSTPKIRDVISETVMAILTSKVKTAAAGTRNLHSVRCVRAGVIETRLLTCFCGGCLKGEEMLKQGLRASLGNTCIEDGP